MAESHENIPRSAIIHISLRMETSEHERIVAVRPANLPSANIEQRTLTTVEAVLPNQDMADITELHPASGNGRTPDPLAEIDCMLQDINSSLHETSVLFDNINDTLNSTNGSLDRIQGNMVRMHRTLRRVFGTLHGANDGFDGMASGLDAMKQDLARINDNLDRTKDALNLRNATLDKPTNAKATSTSSPSLFSLPQTPSQRARALPLSEGTADASAALADGVEEIRERWRNVRRL